MDACGKKAAGRNRGQVRVDGPAEAASNGRDAVLSAEFFVEGVPVQQGNTRSAMVNGRCRTWHREGERLKGWRRLVALAAAEHFKGGPFRERFAVSVDFVMPRPASHVKKDGELRAGAPKGHTSKPDIDKLLRAVLDGLTGTVYFDDSQVAVVLVSKRWAACGEPSGASLIVCSFGD